MYRRAQYLRSPALENRGLTSRPPLFYLYVITLDNFKNTKALKARKLRKKLALSLSEFNELIKHLTNINLVKEWKGTHKHHERIIFILDYTRFKETILEKKGN